ncbi:SpaH/EbpB family LPXTG-anchored major pilin [Enterococcus viikkiensis]|uniref:SpaH/EbpB family LPXTG-anchored major pilin n=1 Tax=Enterococcus viikkiensis TaxID=930854 RepID=UPI0010FA43AF|nr:SpaH/EbpB family LPXTG-anchored major pilin [Enterococcus viikkiensis]
MKNRGKVISFIMALLCVGSLIAGFVGFGNEASAAGETVSVTLHKKKMDEFPTAIQNDGKVNNLFDHFQGLKGVTFTPYDVTEDFYKALDNKLKTESDYKKAIKEVVAAFKLSDAPAATPAAASGVTDDNGNVTFGTLPKRTDGGIYKVYFFKEDIPAGYTDYAGYPTLLVLPAMDTDGTTEIEDIHLYPKNKLTDKENPKKDLLDDAGEALPVPSDGYYIYDIGKVISYKASFAIPSQIGEILHDVGATGIDQTRYTKFQLKDEVSVTGLKFEGISKIIIGGTELTGAAKTAFMDKMTLTEVNTADPYADKAGFTLAAKLNDEKSNGNATKFNESKATAEFLKQYAGQKMEVVYGVSFTKETQVDVKVENDFLVNMEHSGGQEDNRENDKEVPGIATGGAKFFKHEAGKTDQGLQGAIFVIYREVDDNGTTAKEYLKQASNTNAPSWTTTIGDAKEFVSGVDGKFEVTGLAAGDYKLKETKAPHGFQLLTEDKAFKIEAGSYSEKALEYDVPNVSKGGFLPSTGGTGILAFLVVGLGLMTFAYFRYRKVQHTAA